jgi:hypothetical protein
MSREISDGASLSGIRHKVVNLPMLLPGDYRKNG